MSVRIVAEGASDAKVLSSLVEAVFWYHGPQWVRDQLENHGVASLVQFGEPDGTACITWSRVKSAAQERRIRVRRRGDPPHVTEVRKALAVLGDLADGFALIHRDATVVPARDREAAREVSGRRVLHAYPDPCTEGWVLASQGQPVPDTDDAAKAAAGRAGLRDEEIVRERLQRSDLQALRTRPEAASFLDDVLDHIVPEISR